MSPNVQPTWSKRRNARVSLRVRITTGHERSTLLDCGTWSLSWQESLRDEATRFVRGPIGSARASQGQVHVTSVSVICAPGFLAGISKACLPFVLLAGPEKCGTEGMFSRRSPRVTGQWGARETGLTASIVGAPLKNITVTAFTWASHLSGRTFAFKYTFTAENRSNQLNWTG